MAGAGGSGRCFLAGALATSHLGEIPQSKRAGGMVTGDAEAVGEIPDRSQGRRERKQVGEKEKRKADLPGENSFPGR